MATSMFYCYRWSSYHVLPCLFPCVTEVFTVSYCASTHVFFILCHPTYSASSYPTFLSFFLSHITLFFGVHCFIAILFQIDKVFSLLCSFEKTLKTLTEYVGFDIPIFRTLCLNLTKLVLIFYHFYSDNKVILDRVKWTFGLQLAHR